MALLGMFLSGFFTVTTVQLVGDKLPADQIIPATDVLGKNVFRVRSDQVVERLGHLPAISVDHVEVSFPGQVTVYARVRSPVAAWRTASGTFLLDRSGLQIGQTLRTTLPIITGGNRAPDGSVVQAVQYAATSIPSTPNGSIAGFRIDPQAGLIIVGSSGWQAVAGTGSAQTMVRRVATLAAFLNAPQTRSRHLTFVDLHYRQPYAKFAP
ncbi:MAG: hypothetical protein NVSMB52_13800 [Chloroflexota bacterium]